MLGNTDAIYVNDQQGDVWFKQAGVWTLRGANAWYLQGKQLTAAVIAPSDGDILVYDQSLVGGVGGWKVQAGTATAVRATTNITSTALGANAQVKSYKLTIAKTFDVLKVESALAFPVRLRVYSSATFRDADAARSRYSQPTPGTQHGCILDVVLTTATGFTWVMSPLARGETSDGTDRMYYTVDNLDTVARNIDLTVTYLKGE